MIETARKGHTRWIVPMTSNSTRSNSSIAFLHILIVIYV